MSITTHQRAATEVEKSNGLRMVWMDHVRGLAALCVLLEHLLAHYIYSYQKFKVYSFHLGFGAVIAFLLISGYVISGALQNEDIRSFWISRFFRIYPLYWITLGLTVLASLMGLGTRSSTVDILLNATLVQSFAGVKDIVGVAWTLGIEMAFYLSASLTVALRFHRFTTLLATIAACSVFVSAVTGGNFMLVLCYATPWMGMLLYNIKERGSSHRSWIVYFGLPTFLVICAFYGHVSDEWFTGKSFAALVSYVVVPALAFKYRPEQGSHVSKVASWLGRISYSVYLLHPFAIAAAAKQVTSWSNLNSIIVSTALTLVSTLTVSSLAYKYIELPAIRVGKRFRLRNVPRAA